ncbi:putative phage terminase large subunit-like protein [Ancylobacter sp. 3268]|uniref:phage terminase large subunit n=1 Tax=Ancylobacter sp. 3268 TaxID=2817752 RepID=UPI0028557B6E|nr:phage terminase large subunit [Ancylobacter sp. 3268]MDR6952664.1 putative phage terminase large subunit-like protein [Ancylobacter sp. 3268]
MIRRPDLAPDLSAKEFRDQLAEFTANYRSRVELECAAFPVDEAAKAERRSKAKDPVTGLRFFAETYFPHYLTKAPSLLHLHLFEDLPRITSAGGGAREVKIAPRGAAKSTIISLIYPIWRDLIERSRYIIIVMDSYAQAALQLEAIKSELEVNPRLAMDFPELVGQGRVWREGEIVTRSGVRMEGVGSGMKLRGRRHGPHRPDLVVLDDIENDENVRSPEQRDKLESWVLKAVLKLGPADGSLDLLHIGTVVHWDAVILRNAKRPGWRLNRFKALMELPADLQLWDRFEEVLRNDGEEAARDFYAENRVCMDQGALLNWPAMQTLLQLMMERIESPAAFASEQQGEPTPENAPFQKLHFYVLVRRDWLHFGAVDPSLGKSGKGRDPSAILVGALDRTGNMPVLNVVEASIRKRLPDVIIADTIALQREYQCQLWAVETVQFQEFLRTELMARALKEGVMLPAMPIDQIADKTLRIERLQPHTSIGAIRFSAAHATLLQQLQQWPHADHDDGPDALEMLWGLAIRYGAGAVGSLASMIGGSAGTGDTFGGYRL